MSVLGGSKIKYWLTKSETTATSLSESYCPLFDGFNVDTKLAIAKKFPLSVFILLSKNSNSSYSLLKKESDQSLYIDQAAVPGDRTHMKTSVSGLYPGRLQPTKRLTQTGFSTTPWFKFMGLTD